MTFSSRIPLGGIIPPLPTPFTGTGDIDAVALGRLCDHLVAGGVDAVFVAGTAGLGPLLTERQYARLMELASEALRDRAPLVAGVIECSTPRVIDRLRLLESLGCRHFVVTPTYYLPPGGQDRLLRHFGACAEATSMEMVVYNIPACTGINIEVDTVMRMVDEGWTRTIKDSSGDEAHFNRLCAAARGRGVAVFQGLRPHMATLVAQGAAGCVPVPGNLCPSLFAGAWKAAREGHAGLDRLQAVIDRLWACLVKPGDFLTGTLHGLARAGLMEERLPEPLTPVDAGRGAEIRALLSELKEWCP